MGLCHGSRGKAAFVNHYRRAAHARAHRGFRFSREWPSKQTHEQEMGQSNLILLGLSHASECRPWHCRRRRQGQSPE
jgi:hypothetical protein